MWPSAKKPYRGAPSCHGSMGAPYLSAHFAPDVGDADVDLGRLTNPVWRRLSNGAAESHISSKTSEILGFPVRDRTFRHLVRLRNSPLLSTRSPWDPRNLRQICSCAQARALRP